MSCMQIDVLREIGSIGTGNAATALSETLSDKIEMKIPEVSILDYDDAISKLGGPESIVAGVLVKMSGEIEGMMLYLLDLQFMNLVFEKLSLGRIEDYTDLSDMETSAIVEIGNIIISSYVSAISKLADISIHLSVPGIAINMLGGIMSVPIIEYGYETDKIMTIGGKFIYQGKELYSNLLLMPEIKSLNRLLIRLGVENG